jgi:hypothetical protein
MTHQILGYLAAILDHWLFWWGAIGLLIVAMIEKLLNRPLRKKWFFIAALACLVVAMFQAWNDENERAEKLLTANGTLTTQNRTLQQDKDRLVAELANKDRPLVVQVPPDPEISKILKTYQSELARLANQVSSPKKRALQVSTDILKFLGEREKGQPILSAKRSVVLNDGGRLGSHPLGETGYRRDLEWTQQAERHEQAMTRYLNDTVADFHTRFTLSVNQVIQDMETAGIDSRMAEIYCTAANNIVVVQNCAVTLGTLAEKLPE